MDSAFISWHDYNLHTCNHIEYWWRCSFYFHIFVVASFECPEAFSIAIQCTCSTTLYLGSLWQRNKRTTKVLPSSEIDVWELRYVSLVNWEQRVKGYDLNDLWPAWLPFINTVVPWNLLIHVEAIQWEGSHHRMIWKPHESSRTPQFSATLLVNSGIIIMFPYFSHFFAGFYSLLGGCWGVQHWSRVSKKIMKPFPLLRWIPMIKCWNLAFLPPWRNVLESLAAA